VLSFAVIGETAALVVAVIYISPGCARMLWLLCLLSSADLAARPSLLACVRTCLQTKYIGHATRGHSYTIFFFNSFLQEVETGTVLTVEWGGGG
jgi:hypothetical protein